MRLKTLLWKLDEALKDWRRYQEITLDEFKRDRDRRNMILYTMLLSIQATLDIAMHLIAERKLRRPNTYRETFEILAENNIITSNLASQLSDLAGFRNIIVHIYWDLDLEEVYNVLQKDLQYLEAFYSLAKNLLSETKN